MKSCLLTFQDLEIQINFKNVKAVNIRIKPPNGKVLVSAPSFLNKTDVADIIQPRMEWIRKSVSKMRSVRENTYPGYRDGEIHYVWGRPHRLCLQSKDQPPRVSLKKGRLVLNHRPGADQNSRCAVLEAWYRDQVRTRAASIMTRMEPVMGVKIHQLYVRRMKTRWGTCNVSRQTIRLNTELASRPFEGLQFITVHEMTHLLEPSHNARFYKLMDKYLPQWRHFMAMLKQPLEQGR